MSSESAQRLILSTITLIWSLITLVFLISPLHALINQYRSASFTQTPGTIDFIERTITHDADGDDLSGIYLAYHYAVNQQRFNSNVLYFGAGYSTDNWANTILQQFPLHSHPTVYFNPSNPQQSVLLPGPQGHDFFSVLFVTPHAMVMLLLWATIIQSLLPHRSIQSFNLRARGPLLRFRPSPLLPLAVGAATLAGSAFLGTFILVFLDGARPTPRVMSIVAPTLAILSLAAILITALLRSLGRYDITLNDAARTVTKRNLVVPYPAITAIHISNSGHTTKTQINSYLIRIHYMQNHTPSRLTLKSWLPTFETASRLATCLALHVHAPIYDLDENRLLPGA